MWISQKKLPYPYDYFNSIADYQKSVDGLEKDDFFSDLKNKCPDDEEIERTKESNNLFVIKNEEELTQYYIFKKWCNFDSWHFWEIY